jgi:hypothetical protein
VSDKRRDDFLTVKPVDKINVEHAVDIRTKAARDSISSSQQATGKCRDSSKQRLKRGASALTVEYMDNGRTVANIWFFPTWTTTDEYIKLHLQSINQVKIFKATGLSFFLKKLFNTGTVLRDGVHAEKIPEAMAQFQRKKNAAQAQHHVAYQRSTA